MKFYWDLRHLLWSVREWLFVKESMRRLQRSSAVYVHPRSGGPARAILVRHPEIHVGEFGYDHSHAEGR